VSRGLHQEERRQFERLLRQQGVDRLGDRLAVVEAFFSSEEHHTAQEWHRLLAQQGVELEPEFVADTLELMVRFGLAARRRFKDGPPRYEHRHLGEHHDHLICTCCGAIQEFHHPELERLKARVARDEGFHALGHRLQIYGLCPRCRARRSPTMPLAMANPGERLRVERLAGGSQAVRQLCDLGLTVGAELEVLSANGGPLVVALGGTRLALGRGAAQKVLVSPLPPKTG